MGRKAGLAWLDVPQRTVKPQNGHLSTVDLAQSRESPPAKDRRPITTELLRLSQ